MARVEYLGSSVIHVLHDPAAWTPEDRLAMYKAFKQAHRIQFTPRNEEEDNESFRYHDSDYIDWRPYMGAKFFIQTTYAGDAPGVECHGYCNPDNDPESHGKEFFRIAKEYFAGKEEKR